MLKQRPQNKYLVISAQEDAHIEFVEPYLEQPFTIIDPAAITRGESVSYMLPDTRLQVFKNGQPLVGVTSVWYRKPEVPQKNELPVAPYLQAYSRAELIHFASLIRTRFPEALWVSDYYSILRASDKVLQLELAAKLGFNVPRTIVTSSPAHAKQFVDQLPGENLVVKPLESESFTLPNGSPKLVIARRADKKSMDYTGLHLAPSIFQQAIEEGIDVRVAVVRDKVFAATLRIIRPEDRIGDACHYGVDILIDNVKIQPLELPKKVADLCVAHVKELGLLFGAIDLIRDKKGKYWFLENNPNGQWAFVEEVTGQPIGKAVAELLMQGTHSSKTK